MQERKVLFLASNPTDTAQLNLLNELKRMFRKSEKAHASLRSMSLIMAIWMKASEDSGMRS